MVKMCTVGMVSNGMMRLHKSRAPVHMGAVICGSAVWNLLHITLLVARILRWPPDFWRIFVLITFGSDWISVTRCLKFDISL